MGKRVNLNSVAELKKASDEFLPDAFSQLGYEQSFALTDIKLGLGLVTVAIAGFLYYLEKKMSFKDSYYVIVASITVYGLVSAVMYFLSKGKKYKDNIYIGVKDQKHKISVHTVSSPFEPIYKVKIVFDDRYDSALEENVSFTKMFDSFGYLSEKDTVEILDGLLKKKSQ